MPIGELYWQIRNFVINYLRLYQDKLDNESIVHINTYLDAGEYEMALESSMLSAIEHNFVFPNRLYAEALRLSRLAKLDEESTFRGDYWMMLSSYQNVIDQD